jgi:uncharacterized membrane protein YeaQ/YmgE (transglycosylase-associated protein family)
MGIVSCAVLGLIAGCIASKRIDKRGHGFPLNITLGIAGALIGGFLFDQLAASGAATLDLWSRIVAIVGARSLCC